jgi:hypothetical protein
MAATCIDRVEDEGVDAAVRHHVDEADEVSSAPCADPSETVLEHLASPVVIAKRMLEGFGV